MEKLDLKDVFIKCFYDYETGWCAFCPTQIGDEIEHFKQHHQPEFLIFIGQLCQALLDHPAGKRQLAEVLGIRELFQKYNKELEQQSGDMVSGGITEKFALLDDMVSDLQSLLKEERTKNG